jgi:Zn-dependent oligopeptidase
VLQLLNQRAAQHIVFEAAQAFDCFLPHAGVRVAQRLVDNLFAIRNAVDPAEAYRNFRGRDAEIDALMRDRGFPQP